MRRIALLFTVALACTPKVPNRPAPQLFVQHGPAGIVVDVKPVGATAWYIAVSNESEKMVHLVWDESSFVDASGHSYGRLIRGHTLVVHLDQPQMPSLVAPNSTISESCIGENGPEWSTDASNTTGTRPLPEAVTKGIGRMILTFEIDGKKETWEGALSFDGTEPRSKKRAPAAPADAGTSDATSPEADAQ